MEKRRVRIYKAGGEQGSYINKTQQYFQEGGIPQEQQAPAPTDEDIVMFIMQTLSQPNGSIEQAQQQLLQSSIDPRKVNQLSEVALDYINEQADAKQATSMEDDEDATELNAEQEATDRQAAEQIAYEDQQAQLQQMYAQSEEGGVDFNQEDPQFIEDEEDVPQMARRGGPISKRKYIDTFMKLTKKAEGGKTNSTDIPLGGREERVNNFLGSVKNEANTAALKQQAEEQYNQYMQHLQQPPMMQGYAQDGGIFPDQNIDSENPMHHIAAYATSIHDIFDSPQIGTNTELQFGGWGHGKERRAARRMNRMIPQGFNPMMQGNPFMQGNDPLSQFTQFMPNQGNLGLANIDVRRTGMFGRPKEYTINFNQPAYNSNRSEAVTQEIVKDDVAEKEVIPEVVVTADETAPVVAEEVVTKTTLPTADEIEIVGTSNGKKSTSTSSSVSTSKSTSKSNNKDANKSSATTSKSPIRTDLKSGRHVDAKGNLHIRHVSADGKVYNKIMPAGSFTKESMSSWESFKEDPLKWMGYQQGGFTDEESGLTRFTGGGEDFSQYDLDYSDSKNTISPYFQQGGYFQTAGQTDNTVVDILDTSGNVVRKGTLAEAERAGLNHRVSPTTNASNTNTTQNTNPQNFDYAQQYLRSQGIQYNPSVFMPPNGITRGANWNKPVGRPYGTGTLNPISGMIGPNAQVSSIKVDKIRRFGPNKGDAKKFTVNYNVPGKPGINASGTPQSYKGSDGQTHWMGSNEGTKGVIGTADKPESRARSMYRRLTEKNFAPTEQSTTGFHDKNDEAYKKIYGHYPGEDTVDPKLAAELKFIPPTQEQLENETYEPAPTVDSDINMLTRSNKYSPEAIPRESYMQNQEIIPNQFNADPNYQARQEPLPLEEGQEGPSTEEDALYDQQYNQQRNQDLAGFGAGLLGVPNEQDLYNQSQGDVSAEEMQNYELQKMYDQSQQYPELGDLESLDYTQQVGPQAIPENVQPITNASNVRVTPTQNNKNELVSQRTFRRTPETVKKKTPETTWLDDNSKNMSRQERADYQNKEAKNFQKLQDLKESYTQEDPRAFRKSQQAIDNTGKRQFAKMSPTQKLDYLNRLKNVDINLYEGYLKLLQKGGTALPQAQFGDTGSNIPFGYFKDPNGTGVYKNLAGDIHAPKTNFEGNADKLMRENPLAMEKNFTNDVTGQKAGIQMGEDGAYQNNGLLSDEEKQNGAMNQFSQKFKNKQEWNIDAQSALDFTNAGLNKGISLLDQFNSAKQNRNQGNIYNADQLYATTNEKDRGDWDQEGRFRLDQEGDNGLRMGKKGGSLQGEETWMSEEQIRQFLAEGGELEFI